MIKLVRNELVKVYHQKNIIIIFIVLMLMSFLNFFDVGNVDEQILQKVLVKLVNSTTTFGMIFAIVTLGNSLSIEYRLNTITLLYGKSKNRGKFIVAKLIQSMISYIMFVIISTVINIIFILNSNNMSMIKSFLQSNLGSENYNLKGYQEVLIEYMALFPALCQIRGMRKNKDKMLSNKMLLGIFHNATKRNIIFIFRNK